MAHYLRRKHEGVFHDDGTAYTKEEFKETLTPGNAWKALESFYDFAYDEKIKTLNEIFVRRLKVILEVFDTQSRYLIYGSSLLFTYDAMAVRKFINGKLSSGELEPFVKVKLIDFAFVYEADGEKNEHFLSGLRNIISLFECFPNNMQGAKKL